MNPEVDLYLEVGCGRCPLGGTPECKVHNWPLELNQLRALVLDCGLTEEVKWGVPCYTFQGKNILIIAAFKEYCALSFFKGVLLQDAAHLLVKPGENSQSGRYIPFTNLHEIIEKEDLLRTYVFEAIEVEKAGLKVEFKKAPESIPDELEAIFMDEPELKIAFYALTPGRQRGYTLFFSAPKQSKTRTARILKMMPKIIDGKGLNDR